VSIFSTAYLFNVYTGYSIIVCFTVGYSQCDVFAPTGPAWPKISARRPLPHSSCQKNRMNDISFIWYKNVGTGFFRFVTIHAFDRQTDRQTDGRSDGQKGPSNSMRCITCSRSVKTNDFKHSVDSSGSVHFALL